MSTKKLEWILSSSQSKSGPIQLMPTVPDPCPHRSHVRYSSFISTHFNSHTQFHNFHFTYYISHSTTNSTKCKQKHSQQMNILGQSFNESNNGSYSCSSPETGSSSNIPNTFHSDEEVHTLASARPKKRAGRRIFKETRHPVYRGVRRRNNNKWVCEVRVPNDKSTRIWLGTYPMLEMATRAHNIAALTLWCKSTCLNFADSAWWLPLPVSTNAKEIRCVATMAIVANSPTRRERVKNRKPINFGPWGRTCRPLPSPIRPYKMKSSSS